MKTTQRIRVLSSPVDETFSVGESSLTEHQNFHCPTCFLVHGIKKRHLIGEVCRTFICPHCTSNNYPTRHSVSDPCPFYPKREEKKW